MAKKKAVLTADEKVSKEIERLKEIFKDLDQDNQIFVEKLINKVAFMDVTLEDLQDQVKKEGAVVTKTNGNGFDVQQEHPALKSYNSMIKNYINAIKQIGDFLPEANSEVDELLSHVGKNKR